MPERWIDGKGVLFADYRKHLPKLASDFPEVKLVRRPDVRTAYIAALGERWDARCQMCGKELGRWGVRAELHHVVGGARRSDVFYNLLMLCNGATGCHQMVQHQSSMLRIVLAAKCLTDREHTDWVQLAILRGSHLPGPRWPASWWAIREAYLGKR